DLQRLSGAAGRALLDERVSRPAAAGAGVLDQRRGRPAARGPEPEAGAMTDDNILTVEGLQTWFETPKGTVKSVDGVNLTLRRGEILGLVGESGSGKSVTGFSIIGLIDKPGKVVGGRIDYRGEDLRTASEARLRSLRGDKIVMIFQDPMMTLNPVLRIGTQMIETVLAHQKVSRAEARARSLAALAKVGIPH